VRRPWGSFRQYAHNEHVTVSLMSVAPGQRLSLQSHSGRAELWIVLDPGAKIEVDGKVHTPPPGTEIWIPAGSAHRLTSTGPMVRVQQEDITRYEDDYHRPGIGE
jgi:mannose-6-phosphate isomerase